MKRYALIVICAMLMVVTVTAGQTYIVDNFPAEKTTVSNNGAVSNRYVAAFTNGQLEIRVEDCTLSSNYVFNGEKFDIETAPAKSGNKLYYSTVKEKIDLTFSNDRIKENVEIYDKDTLPLSHEITLTKEFELIVVGDGSLKVVKKSTQEPYITIEPPYAIDANNDRYTLTYTWDGKNLTLCGDISKAVYPVKIDPTYTVDKFTGYGVTLALDSNDYPHLSYLTDDDGTTAELWYAVWNGTGFDTEKISSSMDVKNSPSIAIDSNDIPHVAYFVQQILRYTYWDGDEWIISNVETDLDVNNGYPSLAFDSNDYPQISYADPYYEAQEVKFARWNGDEWIISTVDDVTPVRTSLGIDSANYPHVAYYDYTAETLKYAKGGIGAWDVSTVDDSADVGRYQSLVVDSNNHIHISYYDDTNDNLKYACWNGSSWNVSIVDSEGNVGIGSSIALNSDDWPYISYVDVTESTLKCAMLNKTAETWDIDTIENIAGDPTDTIYTSIKVGSDGDVHIGYLDKGPIGWTDWFVKYTTFEGSWSPEPEPTPTPTTVPTTTVPTTTVPTTTPPGSPGFHARATPSETIAPVDTSAYSSFIEAIGGDDSPDNETEAAINWTQAGIAISAPFTDLMGSAFFFVLLSIPFVAMWIAQEKTWIPLLTGIIVLSFATLAGYIPAEYGIAVMAFIALSIAAIVWTLLRSR
ncbi:MAG: hypothetical protein PHH57_07620 [Candidatus Omnitrophica bacterium]|nr:hypothetical protein [Candidatus Omnitrophota bacterium]